MKLAVVSDIHGNLLALRAVVADAGAVDGWLNLGDIVSGPLWPEETAQWLIERGWPTIAGNHERQVLTQTRERMGPPGRPKGEYRSAQHEGTPVSLTDRYAAQRLSATSWGWLAALPGAMSPLAGLRCVHGTPGSDLQYLLETVVPNGLRVATDDEVTQRLAGLQTELLLCGHTHLPRDRRLGTLRIVNPGSVGLPAYDDIHPHPHVVETGSPHARYAVVERLADAWSVNLRAVAYDWETAARQAEANGRGDWADALRSGRVGRTEADLKP